MRRLLAVAAIATALAGGTASADPLVKVPICNLEGQCSGYCAIESVKDPLPHCGY
jgi:hypothetical protein